MKKSYKQCQSCGMPLKKDNNENPKYCSMCFKDGKLINPDMTVEEMQKIVDDALKNEVGAGRLFRWLAKKQIPRLERWK